MFLQTNAVEVIIGLSVKLACSVRTCSFSCLASFKRPTDGCVADKVPLALSELFFNSPDLNLLLLHFLTVSSSALLSLCAVLVHIKYCVKVCVTGSYPATKRSRSSSMPLCIHAYTHTQPVQPGIFEFVYSTNITCN